MQTYIGIVIAVVVVAVMIYGAYATSRRRQELRAWACANGLSYDSSRMAAMDIRFAGFPCLKRGHSRYAYNVMEGHVGGMPIVAFDYHYATGSGKNRHDFNFSAVVAQSPLPLKPLFIRREGFFDKVTEFFGADDIDFESAEFSRKFFVKSNDKRWAYDVIHPRMMEYLLAAPPMSLQFDVMHIIAWTGRRFVVPEFQAAIDHLQRVLELMPDYLVRQQISGTP